MTEADIQNFYSALGTKIKKSREKDNRRITQEILGRNIGMSRTSIVNIEQGRHHIQVHTLLEIAKQLDVSIAELLPENSAEKVTTLPYYTKSFSQKESESIEKELSLIENREVELNVSKNKKNSKKNTSGK